MIDGKHQFPEEELTVVFSRSSGPGGQHINKTSTRVTLRFSLEKTIAFSDEEKAFIRKNLKSRLNSNGEILINCESHRSQLLNRKEAEERLALLLRSSLKRPPSGGTMKKPGRAAREKRLKNKRYRSEIKAGRSNVRVRYDE